jgi:hypothetical protein
MSGNKYRGGNPGFVVNQYLVGRTAARYGPGIFEGCNNAAPKHLSGDQYVKMRMFAIEVGY